MLKKILITLLIVPVIGAAIYGYFHFKQIKTPLSSVIKAIPTNAALILKCNSPQNSFKNFTLSYPMWKSLVAYPFFGQIHSDIHFLEALLAGNKEIGKAIQDKPLFISAHPDASQHYGLLYLINLPNTVTKKQVNDFVQNAAPKTAAYSLRIYDGVALNELNFNENKTLYYFFNKGIFGCTFSRFLVEDAIIQLNSGTPVSNDPTFDKIWNAAGKKVEATLFINYSYFPQLVTNMLESKESSFLKPLSTFANWTSLDISAKSNSLQFSGYTFSKDTSNNYLTIFRNQEPQNITIADDIPSSTAYFYCTAISDLNRYFKNYDTYLNNLTEHFSRQEQLVNLNKKYGVNAQNFFKQWVGNQFASLLLEPDQESYNKNYYALFKTNGNKDVEKILLDFKLKVNRSQDEADTLSEQFRGYELHQIKASALVPLVFGEAFEKLTQSFFVKIGETVVFANSSAALKKWINIRIAKQTLSEDKDYGAFAENIATQSNLYIYSALARSSQLFQNNFKKDILNWNDSKTKTLQDFHAIAFQLSANQNMFYSNIFAEYKPCYKKASQSLFETELDSTIHTKPFIVIDPSDSSRKIAVQDDKNTIYLLDNSGTILWKKEMKEKIMSDIQTVNSKKELQLVFSTKTKIFVLDSDGDNVGKFPIVLKYVATNGVRAIDYDNSGEYRLVIAEENKRIYNFTLRGEPVNGWEAVSNADQVIAPIQNFKAKGLDYLVVLDRMGNVNLLDRKGKSVVKFKQKIQNAYRNTYFIACENTLNASSIIACDSTGQMTQLFFSGKITKSQPVKTNQDFYFKYLSETKNYSFLSKSKLELLDASQKTLVELKLNLTDLLEPSVSNSKNKLFQISISNVGQKLILFSSEELLLSSILTNPTSPPVTTHFFGDESAYTIVGCGKKVCAFAAY